MWGSTAWKGDARDCHREKRCTGGTKQRHRTKGYIESVPPRAALAADAPGGREVGRRCGRPASTSLPCGRLGGSAAEVAER